jgi:hypothetical protein
MAKAKIGEGHVAAMGRLGLAELRNIFNPSRESVADKDMGLYGSATQGEIAKARKGPGDGPEQETMSMDDLRAAAKEKAKGMEKEVEAPDKDRGMER